MKVIDKISKILPLVGELCCKSGAFDRQYSPTKELANNIAKILAISYVFKHYLVFLFIS